MRDQILDLVSRHCDTLRREAADIAATMPAVRADDPGGRASLVASVHKLKGSSGSIGFAEISASAKLMEDVLRGAVGRTFTAAERERLSGLHTTLQDSIARIAPEQSTLFARFR